MVCVQTSRINNDEENVVHLIQVPSRLFAKNQNRKSHVAFKKIKGIHTIHYQTIGQRPKRRIVKEFTERNQKQSQPHMR